MGSYYIPSNKLKGESRILYIFTVKSLIYTAVGGLIGLIFMLIFQALSLKVVGIIILVAFALVGYGIGTIKFPSSGTGKIAKNVGGDSIDEVIMNYFRFRKSRKIYTYSVKREEPDYSTLTPSFDLLNFNKKEEAKNDNITMINQNTKEEK